MRLTTAPSLTLLDLLAPGYPGLLPACGAPLYVRFGLIATEFARRGKLSRRATSFSPNGCYGTSTWDQSALMPTDLITLAHFSVSSAMSLPKSAGETTSGVTPKTASRAFILGSARPALISLLSLSMISAGVFLGMPTPYQLLAS